MFARLLAGGSAFLLSAIAAAYIPRPPSEEWLRPSRGPAALPPAREDRLGPPAFHDDDTAGV